MFFKKILQSKMEFRGHPNFKPKHVMAIVKKHENKLGGQL